MKILAGMFLLTFVSLLSMAVLSMVILAIHSFSEWVSAEGKNYAFFMLIGTVYFMIFWSTWGLPLTV